MSVKHPVVAITGSSGAGTTTVMSSFKHIFRREGINAQIVEGDSFHRYNRMEMRAAMAAAQASSQAAAVPPSAQTDEELMKLFQSAEKIERTPRGAKPSVVPQEASGKKKKSKKSK